MCFTPISVRVAMSFAGLSLMNGIMGSIRTDTWMPFCTSVSTAFKRWFGVGACGSSFLAFSSSSVVMVNATVLGFSRSKSASRVTKLDLVMIWIRQFPRLNI